MWKRTIITNLVGIALLLLGLGLSAGLLVLLGFGILVVSVVYRIATLRRARASRNP
jgi:hypothetical protein